MIAANQYISYLSNPIIHHNRHFLRRLIRILSHYKLVEQQGSSSLQCGVEDHHIVPYHWLMQMGGAIEHASRKRNKLNEDNFVLLPTRAHFLCHVLYVKAFPMEPGLKYCLASMSQKHSLTARMYQYARDQRIEVVRGKKIHSRKSSPLTAEHKANIKRGMANSEKAQISREKLTQYVIDHLPFVHTPQGIFRGQQEACNILNVHQRTLQYRLKSPNFPDWYTVSVSD